MKLTTQRLEIRPICIADKQSLFEYRCDRETNKYQGWIPRSIEDVEEFIGKLAIEINQPKTWVQLAIIEKTTKKHIGDIGIHFVDKESKQVEIGYTLSKKYQGNGFATEALAEVVNYLFNKLNKYTITASIDPKNTQSIKLITRLGFKLHAHHLGSLFLNGKWMDELVYKISKEEWSKSELE